MEEMKKEEKGFYDIIKRVIVTEKATRLMEFENKMILEVSPNSTKTDIKLAIESELSRKVKAVNIINSINGNKKAIVTFSEDNAASDLASQFGVV